VVLTNMGISVEDVFWKPCSSCWSSHLLQEEFLLTPIHSPSLVRLFGPSIGIRARFGSSLTLASLRSKDGVQGTGLGSSALRWEELPDVTEAYGGVLPQKGSDPLGRYGEHNLCSS
jgi:hypothetical protein